MRIPLSMLFVLAALLAACAPVGTRELHEVVLVSASGASKLRYAYGTADTMVLNGRERRLGAPVGGAAEDVPFAVAGARRVDDAPYLRTGVARPFDAPLEVARIPLSSDLRVRVNAPVARALYFDGSTWLSLGRDLEANRTVTVAPAPRSGGLRGVGSLTPAEADAIASAVARPGRPTLVALLPDDAYGSDARTRVLAPRPEDGLDEYRHTAVWIQSGLEVDPAAYVPPPQERIFDLVARGDRGEDPGEDAYLLLTGPDALRTFWNAVHDSPSTPPPVPEVRFGRETLVGVRLSARPSGGYGVEVEAVSHEDGALHVDLRLVEPAPGAVTTASITTPWVLVRVLGVDAEVVWFRDADTGELVAVARGDQSEVF